jgi:hypothetical protein
MKITKSQLQTLIKESIKETLSEQSSSANFDKPVEIAFAKYRSEHGNPEFGLKHYKDYADLARHHTVTEIIHDWENFFFMANAWLDNHHVETTNKARLAKHIVTSYGMPRETVKKVAEILEQDGTPKAQTASLATLEKIAKVLEQDRLMFFRGPDAYLSEKLKF